MSETTLLPCPFCPESDVDTKIVAMSFCGPHIYAVHCKSCQCVGPNGAGQEKATTAWNTRVPLPKGPGG